MSKYEDKIIIDYIRIKLGRYTLNKDKNINLKFNWDVQDSDKYLNNKKILDIFDDYYNNKKIICKTCKGNGKFIIIDKKHYDGYLWIKLNTRDVWENKDELQKIVNYDKYIEIDVSEVTTSELIYKLIKMCNMED